MAVWLLDGKWNGDIHLQKKGREWPAGKNLWEWKHMKFHYTGMAELTGTKVTEFKCYAAGGACCASQIEVLKVRGSTSFLYSRHTAVHLSFCKSFTTSKRARRSPSYLSFTRWIVFAPSSQYSHTAYYYHLCAHHSCCSKIKENLLHILLAQ